MESGYMVKVMVSRSRRVKAWRLDTGDKAMESGYRVRAMETGYRDTAGSWSRATGYSMAMELGIGPW